MCNIVIGKMRQNHFQEFYNRTKNIIGLEDVLTFKFKCLNKEGRLFRVVIIDPLYRIIYDKVIVHIPKKQEYILGIRLDHSQYNGKYRIYVYHQNRHILYKEVIFNAGQSLEKQFKMTCYVEIYNPNKTEIKNVKVYIMLPQDIPRIQRILSLKNSHSDAIIVKDKDQNKFWFKKIKILLPKRRILIGYEAIIKRIGKCYLTTDKNLPRYRLSTIIKEYTKPEAGIESNAPTIRNIAKMLEKNAKSSSDFVLKAQSWIKKNIKYRAQRGERGALYAIKHREGDCTEFTALLVALCRAVGIPARMISGFLQTKTKYKEKWAGHAWAEVYLSNTWIEVDPTSHRTMTMMGFSIDPNRIATIRGNWMDAKRPREINISYSRLTNQKEILSNFKYNIKEV